MLMKMNCFELLVHEHPKLGWHMNNLSQNPAITPEFIELHQELNWNVKLLSYNSSITPKFIKKHLDWEWSIQGLSRNPAIPLEFILEFSNWNWDMESVCERLLIDTKIIEEKYPNLKLNMDGLSKNPHLTLEYIKKNIHLEWNVYYLSRHPVITPEFIEEHIDWNWDIYKLCENHAIDTNLIKKIGKLIPIYNISSTSQLLIFDEQYKWDMEYLSKNLSKNLSTTQESKESKESHYMYLLSQDPGLSPEYVKNNLNLDWNMEALSGNPMTNAIENEKLNSANLKDKILINNISDKTDTDIASEYVFLEKPE